MKIKELKKQVPLQSAKFAQPRNFMTQRKPEASPLLIEPDLEFLQ
jgi:hypothetical protein